MVLVYAQQRLELREIVLKHKPEAMLQASPKGTVPVLVVANGDVIDESREIIDWALARHDPEAWQTDLATPWLDECDGEFKHWLDRYKYADDRHGRREFPHDREAHADRFPEQEERYYRERGERFLAKLDAALKQQAFILGDAPSIADVGIFPFVRQFAFVDKAWFDACTAYPHVQRWLQYWLDSALFTAVMTKYPPWQAGDQPLEFPE